MVSSDEVIVQKGKSSWFYDVVHNLSKEHIHARKCILHKIISLSLPNSRCTALQSLFCDDSAEQRGFKSNDEIGE